MITFEVNNMKFELTLEDIIDIFRAGVDRGNDEATSYEWGCSPTSSFNSCLAYAIKDVLNKDKKWDDSDYIQVETVMEWIKDK